MKSVMSILCCTLFITTLQCMQEPQSNLPTAQAGTCAAVIPHVQEALEYIRATSSSKPLEQCSTIEECVASYRPTAEYFSELIECLNTHADWPFYGINKITPAITGPYIFWNSFSKIKILLAYHAHITPHPEAAIRTATAEILNDLHNHGMNAVTVAYKEMAIVNEYYHTFKRQVNYLSNVDPLFEVNLVQKVLHEGDAIEKVLSTVTRLRIAQGIPASVSPSITSWYSDGLPGYPVLSHPLLTQARIFVPYYAESNSTACRVRTCLPPFSEITSCPATELLHASQITDPQQLPHTAAVIEQPKEIAERFKNERKSSS